jgi:NAD(P)-dependent dehydrogenase (short-subunit alcohol dehydrogenase family)
MYYRLYDVMLAFAVARHWPDVTANAMAPGWVRTKMGGSSAPGSMDKAIDLSIRLTGSTSKSEGSGKYFSAQGSIGVHPDASNVEKQEKLLKICEELSGVPFPRK